MLLFENSYSTATTTTLLKQKDFELKIENELMKNPILKNIKKEQVKIIFHYYDSYGDLKSDTNTSSSLLYINIAIQNIKSETTKNVIIGDIEYGNCYIYILNDNTMKYSLKNITNKIPNILFFPIENEDNKMIDNYIKNMKSEVYSVDNDYGKYMNFIYDDNSMENVRFIVSDISFPPLNGIFHFYNQSLIFQPYNSAPILILPEQMCNEIKRVEIKQYKCSFILLYMKHPSPPYTSNYFLNNNNNNNIFYIYISQPSNANSVFIDVLNEWKKYLTIPINTTVVNDLNMIEKEVIYHINDINPLFVVENKNNMIYANMLNDISYMKKYESLDIKNYIPLSGKNKVIILIGYNGSYVDTIGKYLVKQNSQYQLLYINEEEEEKEDNIYTNKIEKELINESKNNNNKVILLCLQTSRLLKEIYSLFYTNTELYKLYNIQGSYVVINPNIIYKDNSNRLFHISQINNLTEEICDGIFIINRHNSIQKTKIYILLSQINSKVERIIVSITDDLDVNIGNEWSNILSKNNLENRIKLNCLNIPILLTYYYYNNNIKSKSSLSPQIYRINVKNALNYTNYIEYLKHHLIPNNNLYTSHDYNDNSDYVTPFISLNNIFIYVHSNIGVDNNMEKKLIIEGRIGDNDIITIDNETVNIKDNYIVFYGYNLNKTEIDNEIIKCYYSKPYLQLLNINTLTKDDIEAAVELYGYNHLKPGFFYIGNHYVGPTGEYYQEHPFLKDVLEDYISHKNEEINKYNNSL